MFFLCGGREWRGVVDLRALRESMVSVCLMRVGRAYACSGGGAPISWLLGYILCWWGSIVVGVEALLCRTVYVWLRWALLFNRNVYMKPLLLRVHVRYWLPCL